MKEVDCKELFSRGDWYDLIAHDYRDDIPFYLGLAKESGSPVLELACGTGRIGIPMIEGGFDYHGVDISDQMLDWFKQKASRKNLNPKIEKQDIRLLDLNNKFNLIFYPFTAIAHIHERNDIRAFLKKVREHLADTGVFAFDTFNPSVKILNRDPDERFPVHEFVDPESGEKVIVEESCKYDNASQINHVIWYYQIGNKVDEIQHELNVRIYYPEELDFILECCGFEIVNKYGYFDKSPFESDSKRMVYVCRKA